MKWFLHIIIAAAIPTDLKGFYKGSTRGEIVRFVHEALRAAPFYIKFGELFLRPFFCLYILLLRFLGGEKAMVKIFALVNVTENIFLMYRSLALFALFESPPMNDYLAAPSVAERQKLFREKA